MCPFLLSFVHDLCVFTVHFSTVFFMLPYGKIYLLTTNESSIIKMPRRRSRGISEKRKEKRKERKVQEEVQALTLEVQGEVQGLSADHHSDLLKTDV